MSLVQSMLLLISFGCLVFLMLYLLEILIEKGDDDSDVLHRK